MTIDVKVPVLPESVSDATLATWHKKPGEAVKRDENLVDIETDKVVLEVVATADGILEAVSANEGDTVLAEQVIGTIKEGVAAVNTPSAQAKPEAEKTQTFQTNQAQNDSEPQAGSGEMSPSVRRLAREHDIDVNSIRGTGKDGKITKDDIEKAIHSGSNTIKLEPKSAASTAPAPVASGSRHEERVPMTRLRAKVAERLVSAQQTAAILTTFNEVDMSAVMALRKEYKDQFEKKHEVRLGFMSFFIKAVCEALKRFPAVNASVDGKDIVYHNYMDIGVAVSSPRGLVVPVIRNAEAMSIAELERQVANFGQKAKNSSLTMDDLTGGTFTISNGGVFGSLMSTPILNPPQTGILGMHKIQERPVVVNGQIVVRPMMYLALSYDHRLIDGSESVRFLVTVKELIEDPKRLLLEI